VQPLAVAREQARTEGRGRFDLNGLVRQFVGSLASPGLDAGAEDPPGAIPQDSLDLE